MHRRYQCERQDASATNSNYYAQGRSSEVADADHRERTIASWKLTPRWVSFQLADSHCLPTVAELATCPLLLADFSDIYDLAVIAKDEMLQGFCVNVSTYLMGRRIAEHDVFFSISEQLLRLSGLVIA